MADLIIKKWQCDRCKGIYNERPPTAKTKLEAAGALCGEWATEWSFTWTELCEHCYTEVLPGFNDLMKVRHMHRGDSSA